MRSTRYLLGFIAALALMLPVSAEAQRTANNAGGPQALGALNECVSIDVEGLGTATVDATGAWSGTVTFYVAGLLGTRNQVDAAKADTPATAVNTTTANGVWTVPVAGYKTLLACMTSYTSGSARVGLLAAGTGGGSGGGGVAGTVDIELAGTAVSVNAGAADAGTIRVDLANDGAAVDALTAIQAATESLNTGAAVDAEHDAVSPTTGPLGLAYASAATPAAVSADGDAVRLWADLNGRLHTASEKAEDAAHTTADLGIPALCVRDDTLSADGADADYLNCKVDASGAVYTRDIATLVDDAAFTAATSRVLPAGFIADEGAAADSADTGDATAVRATLDRVAMFTPVPHATASGLSIYRSIDLGEGTGEVIKNAAGQLYSLWVTNTATATRFVKIYDATSCTMGTGTPVITVGIPGNTSDDVAGQLTAGGYGITFATGICFGATTGVADADTGAPGANDVIANAFYK